MSFSIEVDGIIREFAFSAPIGWERWVEANSGGLPYIIALHGAGQPPTEFITDWPFYANVDGNRNLSDRYFTFYPFASTVETGATPRRAWNTGWSNANLADVDDIKFIRLMRSKVEDFLTQRLQTVGIPFAPFDENRQYLFGYSAGGMLAHRISHFDTNRYAALWCQSAAFGGRYHFSLGSPVSWPPVSSLSDDRAHSFFHHHGGGDMTVRPTGSATDPPQPSPDSRAKYINPGGLASNQADRYQRADYPPLAGIEAYKTHNNTTVLTTLSGQPDRNGGNTSTHQQWRRTGGATNPIVEYYLDPTMDHTNFPSSPNRYFDAADVWAWFKAHPRVP
ncbi:MAG: hypothetical protein R3F61_25910 [Myxococcota bacterium]